MLAMASLGFRRHPRLADATHRQGHKLAEIAPLPSRTKVTQSDEPGIKFWWDCWSEPFLPKRLLPGDEVTPKGGRESRSL